MVKQNARPVFSFEDDGKIGRYVIVGLILRRKSYQSRVCLLGGKKVLWYAWKANGPEKEVMHASIEAKFLLVFRLDIEPEALAFLCLRAGVNGVGTKRCY